MKALGTALRPFSQELVVRTFRQIRPSPWLYTLFISLDGIVNVCNNALWAYFFVLLGDIATGGGWEAYRRLWIYIALTLLFWALYFINGLTSEVMAIRTEFAIKGRILDGVFHTDYAEVSRLGSGEIINRYSDLVTNLTGVYRSWFRWNVVSLWQVIGAFVFGAIFDWRMTIGIVAFGLLTILVNKLYQKTFYKLANALQAEVGRVKQSYISFVRGIETLVTLPSDRLVKRLFNETTGRLLEKEVNLVRVRQNLQLAQFLLSNLFSIGLLLFGGLLIVSGSMTLGTLLGIKMLALLMYNVFNYFGSFFSSFQTSQSAMEKVYELVDMGRPAERPAGQLSPSSEERDAIKVEDLSFGYDSDRPIIRHLSFSIPAGQITAIMGPNGSGKTTLIRLLLGLLTPNEGRIYYYGQCWDMATVREFRRKKVGYVPQRFFLFNGTVRQNITGFSPVVDEERLQRAVTLAGVDVDLDLVLKDNGRQLSGGQRQRIAIARALYRDGELFILDEPASALDTFGTEASVNIMQRLVQEGKTVILVSHREELFRNVKNTIMLVPYTAL